MGSETQDLLQDAITLINGAGIDIEKSSGIKLSENDRVS